MRSHAAMCDDLRAQFQPETLGKALREAEDVHVLRLARLVRLAVDGMNMDKRAAKLAVEAAAHHSALAQLRSVGAARVAAEDAAAALAEEHAARLK